MRAPSIEFQWLSPLGISVILFSLYGAFHIFIGGLQPFVGKFFPHASENGLIRSAVSDAALFGADLPTLFRTNTPFAQLSKVVLHWIGALVVMIGIFHLTIVWFGLRQGQTWAMWALTIGGLIAFPYWILIARIFQRANVAALRWDYPPIILIPSLLFFPAVILGWIGLN